MTDPLYRRQNIRIVRNMAGDSETVFGRACLDICLDVENLERWQREAIAVITQWEDVYHALGSPGQLGEQRSVAALREVKRLMSPAPQPVPAAQVLPVQAVVTQAPAWIVVADGRTIATFSDADDAHAYRRWLNRSDDQ
jgi:hypothetical protein